MNQRLLSVDVMRGMTIFFMIVVNTPGSSKYSYAPLKHAAWHGCTPTDLVFPLFLFIVGVSMSLSLRKFMSGNQGSSNLFIKILKRTALIFIVGLLLNWFPFHHKSIGDLRILGVLQRIALAFGGAGILVVLLKDKFKLAIAAVIILLAYWLMIMSYGDNPYSLEGNLATYLDVKLLGESHVYGGFGIPFDPEGLVSTISGIAHVLIGYLCGLKIISFQNDKPKLVVQLFIIGASLTIAGLIWNIGFPINKPLWTSSYVLFSCGIASMLLACLIWIIELKQYVKWSYIFRVFGLNPLVSYVLSGIFLKLFIHTFNWDGGHPGTWLYEQLFQPLFGNSFGSLMYALIYTLFIWLFAWLLYRKGKIIKL